MEELGFADTWREGLCGRDWDTEVRTAVERWDSLEASVALSAGGSGRLFLRLGQVGARVPAQYLMDSCNRAGTAIMTKLRIGHMLLIERVARLLGVPAQAGVCALCQISPESTQHFLQECYRLRPFREGLRRELAARLVGCGQPGSWLCQEFERGGVYQLDLLLGKTFSFPTHCLEDEEGRAICGKALFAFDKTVKNYLVMCWEYRALEMGKVHIRRGRMEVELEADHGRGPELLARQQGLGQGSVVGLSRFWEDWVPRRRLWQSGVSRGKRTAVVYRVFKGRREGWFYRWCDVVASVANFPGAVVRGYQSFREAYEGIERRSPSGT